MSARHTACPHCGSDPTHLFSVPEQGCAACGHNAATGVRPDFAMLRAIRQRNLEQLRRGLAEEHNWPEASILAATCCHGQGCYCGCPDGPCEHEFRGWREFADGRGGEAVCVHCGLGAMSHDMGFAP